MKNIAEAFLAEMKHLDISYDELTRRTGIPKSSLHRYFTGETGKFPVNLVLPISSALGLDPVKALGWSRLSDARNSIPVLGAIACGSPILADENISSFIDIPSNVKADFALECKGDSMVGARILDGDLVCIRQQDDVTDGQIAAVLIDDEATLKRVYHNADGTITLVAENSKYPPKTIGADLCENIRIIGLATYFISKVV